MDSFFPASLLLLTSLLSYLRCRSAHGDRRGTCCTLAFSLGDLSRGCFLLIRVPSPSTIVCSCTLVLHGSFYRVSLTDGNCHHPALTERSRVRPGPRPIHKTNNTSPTSQAELLHCGFRGGGGGGSAWAPWKALMSWHGKHYIALHRPLCGSFPGRISVSERWWP